MSGIWVLLVLIIAAALPPVIVFFWFRSRKILVSPPWFLAALAAGIICLLAAALIQGLFPPPSRNGLAHVFFNVFIRIALVEEASRLLALIPLLKIARLLPAAGSSRLDSSFGPALGFVAGLGFAAMENAAYGMADISITVLRAFSAAPLHGACGIMAGAAVFGIRRHPIRALALFVLAVFIHGSYNLIIVSPALPSVLAIPTAFAALFAFLHFVNSPAVNTFGQSPTGS